VDLPPVSLRESFVGQHVFLGAQHQFSELRVARLEGLDQLGPVFFRVCQRVLIEGCSECGRDDWAVLLADTGQGISHEVHTAALDGGPQHFGGGSLQPLMIVSDDQLDPAKATIGQRTQEFVPEDLGLAGLNGDAQHLAPPVHCPTGYCPAIPERGC